MIKIEKKLAMWKSNTLSLGGRLILLNSVLTAMPLYLLAMYKASKYVIRKIDKVRSKFLWQGTRNNKKYSLVGQSL